MVYYIALLNRGLPNNTFLGCKVQSSDIGSLGWQSESIHRDTRIGLADVSISESAPLKIL